MEISERIKLIIKSHNLTASSFADKLGIQRSSVSHLLAGRNKPSLDVLQKILTHFPRVNATWLVTGKEPGSQTKSITEESNDEQKPTTDQIKDEDTPTYGVKKELTKPTSEKELISIVKFYSDGSFQEFNS